MSSQRLGPWRKMSWLLVSISGCSFCARALVSPCWRLLGHLSVLKQVGAAQCENTMISCSAQPVHKKKKGEKKAKATWASCCILDFIYLAKFYCCLHLVHTFLSDMFRIRSGYISEKGVKQQGKCCFIITVCISLVRSLCFLFYQQV